MCLLVCFVVLIWLISKSVQKELRWKLILREFVQVALFDFNERSQERMDFGFVRESNSVCSSLSPQKQLKGLEISKDLLKTASFNVSF
jgi:hypothetical protein